jgi:hypothetical protein
MKTCFLGDIAFGTARSRDFLGLFKPKPRDLVMNARDLNCFFGNDSAREKPESVNDPTETRR